MEKSTTTKSPSKPKTATKKPQAAPKAKAAKPVAAPVAEPAPVVEQPAVQPAQPTCCCQKVKNFFNKLFGKKCCMLFLLFLGLLGFSTQAWAGVFVE